MLDAIKDLPDGSNAGESVTALRQMVVSPEETPAVDLEFITPDRARELLARNVDNQPLKTARVALFARAMESHGWAAGQAVIALFGPHEMLGNGQHTLSAIVRSGLGQWCTVIRDRSRTGPRDWLGDTSAGSRSKAYIVGFNNNALSVAALAFAVAADNKSTRMIQTPGELRDMCTRMYPVAAKLTNTHSRGLSAAPVRLAVMTRMALCPDRADEIASRYAAFVTGRVSELTQAMMGVRDQILGSTGYGGAQARLEFLIRCLSCFDPNRDGNTRVQIKDMNHRTREAQRLVREAWFAE